MKKVIYLGQASGIKNLIADKEYSIDTEGDSVYLIKNENGVQTPYSKRFFREVVEIPPPPPPLPPISSVTVSHRFVNPQMLITVSFRGITHEASMNYEGVSISCGIKQISPFYQLIGCTASILEDFGDLTEEECTELINLILTKFFKILEDLPGVMKIFSLSEANSGDSSTEESVYDHLLEFLRITPHVSSLDWVNNPNSGNAIGLYVLYCHNLNELND